MSALEGAAEQIGVEFPNLTVRGVVSDFTESLHHLPRGGRRTIAFLGGTLGNMVPAERAEFLSGIADVLEPGEHLLLGVGLVIDPAVLVPAYDDAAGVTAQFNRNVLQVLNSQLDADFPVDEFRHVALWDAGNEWIEMRLEAERAMSIRIAELDLDVEFAAGSSCGRRSPPSSLSTASDGSWRRRDSASTAPGPTRTSASRWCAPRGGDRQDQLGRRRAYSCRVARQRPEETLCVNRSSLPLLSPPRP